MFVAFGHCQRARNRLILTRTDRYILLNELKRTTTSITGSSGLATAVCRAKTGSWFRATKIQLLVLQGRDLGLSRIWMPRTPRNWQKDGIVLKMSLVGVHLTTILSRTIFEQTASTIFVGFVKIVPDTIKLAKHTQPFVEVARWSEKQHQVYSHAKDR